jgi:hypothetical protein
VTVALRPHTDAVQAALLQAGLSVHRGIGPVNPLGSVPYVVVYAGSTVTSGTVGDLYADAESEVQVTSVGGSSEQAEWANDRVFEALIGAALQPPPGRRWLVPGAPVGHVLTRPVERDLDFGEGAPLFYVVSIFSLLSTPA